jgi:hypothetical protein
MRHESKSFQDIKWFERMSFADSVRVGCLGAFGCQLFCGQDADFHERVS